MSYLHRILYKIPDAREHATARKRKILFFYGFLAQSYFIQILDIIQKIKPCKKYFSYYGMFGNLVFELFGELDCFSISRSWNSCIFQGKTIGNGYNFGNIFYVLTLKFQDFFTPNFLHFVDQNFSRIRAKIPDKKLANN